MSIRFALPFGNSVALRAISVLITLSVLWIFASSAHAAQVVGTTSAKFGVTPGGAASYSIPIAVPKGTAGLQPSLKLQYNSRDKNSIMGLGWKVTGLSYINRCATNLYIDNPEQGGIGIDPVDYDDNDKFCLNGERLMAFSGEYGADGTEYRTYFEEFSKIISHGSGPEGPTSFTVYKKSGEILTYGGTEDSRFRRQTENHVRTWALSKLADAKGNYINYTYHNDRAAGEQYISRIDYTGNSAQNLAPYNRIDFLYEDRPDKLKLYKAGDEITLTKRLNKIQVFSSNLLAHEYRLAYELGHTNRSRLASLTECADAATCFKPTVFEWNDGNSGDIGGVPFREPSTTINLNHGLLFAALDTNGDGIKELMKVLPEYDDHERLTVCAKGTSGLLKVDESEHAQLGPIATLTPISSYSESTPPTCAFYSRARIGDFNGDGRDDFSIGLSITSFDDNGAYEQVSIAPFALTQLQTVADFNGDGITDSLFAMRNEQNVRVSFVPDDQRLLLSKADTSFEVKIHTNGLLLPDYYSVSAVLDVNGDGMQDMYLVATKDEKRKYDGSLPDKIMISKGDGTFQTIDVPASVGLVQHQKVFGQGDFNGDGLIDLYVSGGQKNDVQPERNILTCGRHYVMLSRGDGTFTKLENTALSSFWTPSETFSSSFNFPCTDSKVHILPDANGDGVSDILLTRFESTSSTGISRGLMLSKGDGTFHDPVFMNISDVELKSPLTLFPFNVKNGVSLTGDFNGDGLTDILTEGEAGLHNIMLTKIQRVAFSNFLPGERITGITNGHGLNTKITYKPLTDSTVYTKEDTAQYPVQDTVSARYVVAEVKADNGVGGQNSQTYTYAGLQTHKRGLNNLGFRKMVMTDVPTGIKTESIYNQDWANHHQGLLKESRTIAPDGVVLNERIVNWGVRGQRDAHGKFVNCFRFATSSTLTKRDLNGAFIRRETEETTFDDYGFRTMVRLTSENEDGSVKFVKVANSTFVHNASTWRLGQLTNTTVTHTKETSGPEDLSALTVVRTKSFTYDADGYLLSETVEPGDALFHTKTNTLNAYGMVESVTETWGSTDTDGVVPTARTTSYEFDDKYRFVTKETNPLGHSQANTYHPILGVVASTTGPNGLTTTWDHDVFGRKLKETRADNTTTEYSMEFCGGAITCPSGAVYRMRTVASTGAEKLVFMNKLNLEVKMSILVDSKWSSILTEYDAIGREHRKTQPHFDGEALHWTVTTYDILDRKTRVDRPDTSFQTAVFNGLTQVSTNELGQNKTVTKNLLGKDDVITNHEGYQILYGYDAAGQLLSMNANGGITTYVYDKRGFKVSDSDPDKGAWVYRYNALGKIVEQTNARNETTRMTYDALDRTLTRTDDATAANPEARTATWEYDTAANGIGKVHKILSPGYNITNTYDSLGRVTSTQELIEGEDLTTSTTYDSQSRPDQITYPSGIVIKNTYGAQGSLLKVGKPDDSETWWERKEVDARGNISLALHGNGVETRRMFDPQTGRLTSIYSFKGNEVIQDLTYQKDYLGNLTRREDKRQNQVETFVYDNQNRVTTINTTVGGNTNTVTMTYGITGNILSKSDVGTYTYGEVHNACTDSFAGPHAVTTVTGTKNATYCYDANGNMTSGDGRITSYTAFDKPYRIARDGNTATFLYGPDRKRYKRIDETVADGTKITLYAAGKAFERITDANGTRTKHYVGDFAVITHANDNNGGTTNTSYLHHDHLGSIDTITNEAGTVDQRMSFDSWGKRRETNWQSMPLPSITTFNTDITTRGFTGHEMIDAVGLVHMNGRVYEPELGRFLSADPIVEAIDNLQTYNRYSYVRNNPLTLTDPSGFQSAPGDGENGEEGIEDEGGSDGAEESLHEQKVDHKEGNKGTSTPTGKQDAAKPSEKSLKVAGVAEKATVTTTPKAPSLGAWAATKRGAKVGSRVGGFIGGFFAGKGAFPGAVVGGIFGGLIGYGVHEFFSEKQHSDNRGQSETKDDVPADERPEKGDRSRPEIEVDETGKVHGRPLPTPDKLKDKDLDKNIEALKNSIKIREEEQLDKGEHGSHRGRIGEERDLLRQLEKRYRDRQGFE